LRSASMNSLDKLRNIAIVAHVDHGKTTLVDRLLQQSGTLGERAAAPERIMDSNDLERERGITILAKNTALRWRGYRINIVDTPGHADFGGEVERILSMVDAVLLLVDAVDGPMPQSRFVTQKAFARGLKPIVVINKVDRPGARPHWALDQTFELFDRLGATDEQLDFPVVYCSAFHGYAGLGSEDIDPAGDMTPLFETIVKFVPSTNVNRAGPFQMQISSLAYSSYVGAIGVGRIARGTVRPNTSVVVVDRDGRRFAAQVSSLAAPPRLELTDVGGDRRVIADNSLDATHPYFPYLDAHSTPQLGSLPAADGQTLWYRMALPNDFDPARRYPVVVDVYGGPGVQRVRNDWTPLSWQLFTQAGFAVFQLDNRGGGNRDKRFEGPIAHALGDVEVQDQLAGVEFLRRQAWVDAKRIGVMGHSYGGYMTLKCLSRAPGTFAAGVAGAPVTDWAQYDTHYTERYLGTPHDNAEGYRTSSVFAELAQLRDPLLVIHGMADDNVLFTHSTMLFKALQDRGVPFEIMTYPGAKHALQQRSVATHRLMTILGFFKRHLRV